MTDNRRMLDEAELEQVSGGRGYSEDEYKTAGVVMEGSEYYAKFSDGKTVKINKTVANSMVDCFKLNGQKLTDEMLQALIEQCR